MIGQALFQLLIHSTTGLGQSELSVCVLVVGVSVGYIDTPVGGSK